MRLPSLTILFTVVLTGLVIVSSLFAQNWLFRRATPAITNVEEVRATLKSLVPTKAEAEAIAQLRQKVQESANGNVPIQETEAPDARMSIKVSYISVNSPLAKMIITEPAMNWSTLLPSFLHSREADEKTEPYASHTKASPGRAWLGTFTETPLYVRFLDETNLEKFCRMIQLQHQASFMEAPQIFLNNGQTGSIQDVTAVPFVEGVNLVRVDWEKHYLPLVRLFNRGTILMLKGTVLQDGSCLLEECVFNKDTIKNVEQVRLLEEDKKLANGKVEKNSVTAQVPEIQSFQVNLPAMVVPKGMSLLLAFPGVRDLHEDMEMFLLITPRAFDPAEHGHGEGEERPKPTMPAIYIYSSPVP